MKGTRKIKIQIAVDSILGLAFLFAFQPRFTGLPVHEWMGLALGGVVLSHLLLGWQWIYSISKRFLGKLPTQTRVLYLLNLALLVALVGVAVTGVLISKVVFHHQGEDRSLLGLHKLFANGVLVLMAFHLALNWQWVVNVAQKYVRWPSRSKVQVKALERRAI